MDNCTYFPRVCCFFSRNWSGVAGSETRGINLIGVTATLPRARVPPPLILRCLASAFTAIPDGRRGEMIACRGNPARVIACWFWRRGEERKEGVIGVGQFSPPSFPPGHKMPIKSSSRWTMMALPKWLSLSLSLSRTLPSSASFPLTSLSARTQGRFPLHNQFYVSFAVLCRLKSDSTAFPFLCHGRENGSNK